MRALLRVELAQPLNTDGLHLGRPPADAPTQTAQIIAPQSTRANPLFNLVAPKIAAFPFSAGFGAMYFPGMKAFVQGDIPILDGEVPAANGVCTARALARVYGAIADGGQLEATRFLSPELVSGLTGRPSLRPDYNLFLPLAWHMGYHAVPIPGVLPGFGHAGMGGSIGWADPASGIAFSFVHNRLLTPMIFDQATFIGLGALLRRSAAAARRHGHQTLPDFGAPYPTPAKVAAGYTLMTRFRCCLRLSLCRRTQDRPDRSAKCGLQPRLSASRRNTGQLADLDAKPLMPLLQLAADPREEIMRVDLDALELDPQHARFLINDDAAGRMQWVLVAGSRGTRAHGCHQLISVIIPEPVRHGRDDFLFELVDVDGRWHGHRQAAHLHHATKAGFRDPDRRCRCCIAPMTPSGVPALDETQRRRCF